jgi:hypothetical protein
MRDEDQQTPHIKVHSKLLTSIFRKELERLAISIKYYMYLAYQIFPLLTALLLTIFFVVT